MNKELSFTNLDYSTGASLFFLSYLMLHVPASLLSHHIGARKGLALMLCCWGAASSAMALVSSRAAFFAVRAALGIAETGFYPAVTLYLTHWHASSTMGVNFSIIAASTTLAGVLGGPLATSIMSAMDGAGGWSGWRWMYMLTAAPALLYATRLTRKSCFGASSRLTPPPPPPSPSCLALSFCFVSPTVRTTTNAAPG
jgi:MFS family permease